MQSLWYYKCYIISSLRSPIGLVWWEMGHKGSLYCPSCRIDLLYLNSRFVIWRMCSLVQVARFLLAIAGLDKSCWRWIYGSALTTTDDITLTLNSHHLITIRRIDSLAVSPQRCLRPTESLILSKKTVSLISAVVYSFLHFLKSASGNGISWYLVRNTQWSGRTIIVLVVGGAQTTAQTCALHSPCTVLVSAV